MSRNSIESRFREATRLRDAGDLDGSAGAFEALAADYPDRAAIWGPRFELARHAFQRATELSPRSELASISLFHALYRLGRRDDAIAEMNRYLALVPESEEYGLVREELGLIREDA